MSTMSTVLEWQSVTLDVLVGESDSTIAQGNAEIV
jgi:hypothetical protein